MPDHYDHPEAKAAGGAGTEREGELDAIAAFATHLYTQAVDCARRRSGVEERMYLDTLQYQGYYDDETAAKLKERPNSSKLFVNQTRPKADVMRDRLIETLFPKDEANWDIQPTPVPALDREAVRFHNSEKQPELAARGEAARETQEEFRRRNDEMRKEIADQLEECRYSEVGEMVIEQACKLGTGICKGPYSDGMGRMAWQQSGNAPGKAKRLVNRALRRKSGRRWKLSRTEMNRPRYQWVNTWDFFPDMDARRIEECEYTYQLHRMSKRDLRKHAGTGEFDRDEVKYLLDQDPNYSPIDQNFSEHTRYLRALDESSTDGQEYRYSVLEYHGPVPYDELKEIAAKFDQGEILDMALNPEDPLKTVEAIIWFCQDRILKFGLKPTQGDEPTYSVYTFCDSDSSIFGVGIPFMVRDPQAALNSAWRMMLENGGLSGVPMFVIDRDVVEPVNGDWTIGPNKLWWKIGEDDDGVGIEAVAVEGNSANLQGIVELALRFMDDESRLPLIAQGDPGTSARQTAHGMSLLVNAVNIVFKSAAKRFDRMFTIPNIRRIYHWNMEFSSKNEIKGDYTVKALGSSVLLVREMQAQNLLMVLNLAVTNPVLQDMLRVPSIARKLFQALQMDKSELVLTDEELEQLAQKKAQEQEIDPEVQMKLQLEQMKQDGENQRLEMQLQIEMVRLAQQGETTIEKIKADLQKAELDVASKERLFMAEAGLKERHGEGI